MSADITVSFASEDAQESDGLSSRTIRVQFIRRDRDDPERACFSVGSRVDLEPYWCVAHASTTRFVNAGWKVL